MMHGNKRWTYTQTHHSYVIAQRGTRSVVELSYLARFPVHTPTCMHACLAGVACGIMDGCGEGKHLTRPHECRRTRVFGRNCGLPIPMRMRLRRNIITVMAAGAPAPTQFTTIWRARPSRAFGLVTNDVCMYVLMIHPCMQCNHAMPWHAPCRSVVRSPGAIPMFISSYNIRDPFFAFLRSCLSSTLSLRFFLSFLPSLLFNPFYLLRCFASP